VATFGIVAQPVLENAGSQGGADPFESRNPEQEFCFKSVIAPEMCERNIVAVVEKGGAI
jgi:hypothetical protein